jgi:hypothetical protein
MALSEFEISRYEKLVAEFAQRRRPPPHLRDKVDLAFRVNGQSIELYEVRAHWRDAGKKIAISGTRKNLARSALGHSEERTWRRRPRRKRREVGLPIVRVLLVVRITKCATP